MDRVKPILFDDAGAAEPDSARVTDCTLPGTVSLCDSCMRVEILHDWVDTPYKYFLGGEVTPDTYKAGPDSLSLYMYRIKGIDTRKYAKIQYCRKCGIFRIDLKGVKK